MFNHNLLNFSVFRFNDFFKFFIFIIKGFYLIKMLFFKIFNLNLKIVIKFSLHTFYFFLMFCFFVQKITSKSVFFFPQFSNLELCFFVPSYHFHIEVAYFIIFFITVFFEFSKLKFILFSTSQIGSFKILNFQMLLIFQFIYLDIFHMFYLTNFLLQVLYLIK